MTDLEFLVGKIEHLSTKLTKLTDHDQDAKKFILRELGSLCLDLLKQIRNLESDRSINLDHYVPIKLYLKKEQKIEQLQRKIDRLSGQICSLKYQLENIPKSYSNEELYQLLLQAKEKMLIDYQSRAEVIEVEPVKKRSRLFDW